ncbi:MFS domain-containing protein [Heracleum sosnowskyi]|uniref:MFS domain-containing protein n=1 Tax=Heracleum sosnowskyi TaxID=360622 RepID=A0AAD8J503_9APIA|nr:MFS domain-containing protein [Heracleum sosnowskyi]
MKNLVPADNDDLMSYERPTRPILKVVYLSFYRRIKILFIPYYAFIGLKAAPALAVTGILVYIGSFSIGMGSVPWVVMSEIFDINIKGAGGSLATLVNWFGA